MSVSPRGLGRLAAAVLLLAVAGCGTDEPPLAPVRGRVYYKGVPLTGGSIVFTPDADKGCRGPLARGDIRPDGTYSLRSGPAAGAVAGWHRITIVSVEAPAAKPAGDRFADVRSLIPPRYSAPDLSGLEGWVRPGRDNLLDFHLE
jgi:hypothetical protein